MLAFAIVLASAPIALAANPPPTQLFYVPFPENDQLTAFDSISSVANDPLTVFVTFSAATDGTVIYYDHWEDGYEPDITNPVQSSTLVFGDGNNANGYPPGNASDLIPAGTVFNLRNFVNSGTLQAVLDYDARDKIATFKPISITKTTFPDGTDTLMAGCVEMFERGLWGTEYRSPVGVDMPTTVAAGNLTHDEDVFSYVALSIMAGPGGATVQIDKNNDNTFEETIILTEGQSIYRADVNVGGHVLADRPVQVVMFTGTIGSTYGSRDTTLLPVYRWSSDYFAPVTTPLGNGTVTFLYNPGTSDITVSYDYRNSATTYITATVTVPARGNARVVMSPSNGTSHFGAYRFYTTGTNPPLFYAISTIDADGTVSGTQNTAWDGGFTLVGKPSLTTQVLVSLGIGRDPYSSINPAENGNPIWITTSGNGHTQETVYVDYDGDNAGPFADSNGNRYDIAYSLRELEQQKVFDPDGDQSGMLVYTLNPTVRIAAMWGQDPTVATNSQPGLDVAALVPPLREGDSGKKSNLISDPDGDGFVSAGDMLEYDIRAVNSARSSIPGPFGVLDTLPANVNYVAGSTRYRFSVGGSWQAWTTVPDAVTGTPFPLDGTGFSVPGSLGQGQELQVVFNATVKAYPILSGGSITNTGAVEISPYGLVLPIEWTDTIHGSIGDRVWTDLDGDGVQDIGENGIPGVDVFADLNANGVWETGEPKDTTDAGGNYLLVGLVAGSYQIRVDAADIAAIDFGYGPTFDLDGNSTSHVATVALAAGQDRVDADFGYRIGASVGNRIWTDLDADGVQEAGEPGVNGVRVYLDLNNNNLHDSGEPNTFTAGDGVYYIGNLSPGSYVVRVDTSTLPSGASQTFDLNGGLDHEASVVIVGAEHNGLLDFGYRGNLSIGDLVWEDADANGLTTTTLYRNVDNGRLDFNNDGSFDNSDDGLIGTTRIINGYVDIDNDNATPVDNDDDGFFLGEDILNGLFDLNGNGSISNNTSDDGVVSFQSVTFDSGIPNVRVYIDLNGNGSFDTNEISATTNASGIYTLSNLFEGSHTVRVDTTTLPASYIQTYDLTSPINDHAASVVLTGASRTDVDFGYRNDATLGDLVWNDRDADGIRDAGEQGIEGVIVYVDADNDNFFDEGSERYDITDVDGFYRIENLAAGTHAVRVEISTLPQGATQTYDLDGVGTSNEAARTLAASENVSDVDFGYRASAAIGNFIWNDTDADGVQDGGELGISGVRVYLDINGNSIFDSSSEPSAQTDANGAYSIGNLLPGTYTARVDPSSLPPAMVQTYDLNGALDEAATFFVSATQTRDDIDFGYTSRASIGDLVWNDTNANGQKGAGESGLAGVTVTVFDASNDTISATTITDSNGAYAFASLMPGTYYLVFTAPAGYQGTLADRGADASDSDANAATGRTSNITLTGGQSNLTVDAGFYQPVSIGDRVWSDANANGQLDGGESGLPGVAITLHRPGFGPDGIAGNGDDAAVVATRTSDTSGNYAFTGLPPGTYTVTFGFLSGHARSIANQGADASDSDASVTTGLTGNLVLTAGQTNNTVDAGYYQPATVSGHLYIDVNGNGAQDSGEPDLAGVDVVITDRNNALQTVTTDASGNWSATVPPGSTSANVDENDPQYPAGHTRTQGDDPTVVIAVSNTNTSGGIDGYFLPGSIRGFVLADTNNDNSGDAPLQDVMLTLVNSSGAVILSGGNPVTTTTLADGSYSFANLPPGVYGVLETQPSGYNSVSDRDGGNLDEIRPITVSAGVANTGNNFIEEQPGSISGTVFKDTDGDGDADAPLPGVTLRLLDSAGQPVLDVSNQPVTTLSAANGAYTFSALPPGNYRITQDQPSNYNSVSDTDGENNNIIGNETPVTVSAGANTGGNHFIEIELGVISGHVLLDTDGNGSGNAPLTGVVLNLLDGSGNPVLDGNGDPIQATSGPGGFYSFTLLPVGTYRVSQNQPSGYGSVSDVDGANNNLIGDQTPIVMTPGLIAADRDFVEIELGTISGYVYVDAAPLAGVTLTLLDANGDPVDGDPGSPGVQTVTAVTDSLGHYTFTGVYPGIYQIGQTQPQGYDSVGDLDGGDIDIIGDVTPITLLPGQHSEANNFIESVDVCPDDWAQWKFQHPGELPGGNPDADAYDNFAEFAFAMPAVDGTGSPWLGNTAWIIRPSVLAPGTLEGVFVRPKGAPLNATYTLQYAAVPGSPTVWQSLVITPLMTTTVDNGDCTETVTIHGLESLTGLTGGTGTVRIKVELDESPPSGTDHTSYSETEGWKETPLEVCCRTYNNPYLRESLFTGTVTGVTGQTLDLSGSAGSQDLAFLLSAGSYFIEVTSGDNEGHRFDVVSASANTLELADDSDLFENAPPFNTLAGPLPANLAGDTIILRRHWTLGEIFPASAFGGSLDQSVADQIQHFANGVWTFYWLYDDGGSPPYWVRSGDNTFTDQGDLVIPPGQGLFFNNRTSVTSILAYGEIRANDFIRPLLAGSNLVAGGYPVDQSASGPSGRAMTLPNGFFGSRDIATADSFYIWRGDAVAGLKGYDTYFLNNNAPRLPSFTEWVKIGDASLTPRSSEILLLGNRSVFLRSRNGVPVYTAPSPWNP